MGSATAAAAELVGVRVCVRAGEGVGRVTRARLLKTNLGCLNWFANTMAFLMIAMVPNFRGTTVIRQIILLLRTRMEMRLRSHISLNKHYSLVTNLHIIK